MIKRVISVLLVAMLLLGLLAGCGDDGKVTLDEAKQLVLKDLNIKQNDADSVDVHLTTVDGVACYVVYVSFDGQHWQYTVSGLNGEILDKTQNTSGHTHSH